MNIPQGESNIEQLYNLQKLIKIEKEYNERVAKNRENRQIRIPMGTGSTFGLFPASKTFRSTIGTVTDVDNFYDLQRPENTRTDTRAPRETRFKEDDEDEDPSEEFRDTASTFRVPSTIAVTEASRRTPRQMRLGPGSDNIQMQDSVSHDPFYEQPLAPQATLPQNLQPREEDSISVISELSLRDATDRQNIGESLGLRQDLINEILRIETEGFGLGSALNIDKDFQTPKKEEFKLYIKVFEDVLINSVYFKGHHDLYNAYFHIYHKMVTQSTNTETFASILIGSGPIHDAAIKYNDLIIKIKREVPNYKEIDNPHLKNIDDNAVFKEYMQEVLIMINDIKQIDSKLIPHLKDKTFRELSYPDNRVYIYKLLLQSVFFFVESAPQTVELVEIYSVYIENLIDFIFYRRGRGDVFEDSLQRFYGHNSDLIDKIFEANTMYDILALNTKIEKKTKDYTFVNKFMDFKFDRNPLTKLYKMFKIYYDTKKFFSQERNGVIDLRRNSEFDIDKLNQKSLFDQIVKSETYSVYHHPSNSKKETIEIFIENYNKLLYSEVIQVCQNNPFFKLDIYDSIVGSGLKSKKGASIKTKMQQKITPQRLKLLCQAFETGNTSQIVKKEIVRGVNQLIGSGVFTRSEGSAIKKKYK